MAMGKATTPVQACPVANQHIDGPCAAALPQVQPEAAPSPLEEAMLQAMEGIALMDERGTLVYMNQAYADLHGWTVGELVGRPWSTLYDAEQAALMDTQAFARLPAEGHWRGDVVARKKDGEPFYAELSLHWLTKAEQGRARMACTCRDVTERKWAEAALRESEERYALALQGSRDGHWDWSVDTDYCYFSPRWKALLGYEDHEIANHHEAFVSRIHPDDAARVDTAIRDHVMRRVPYDVEVRLRHKNGRYRWFHSRGHAMWDVKGHALRMAGVLTDMTEQKQAEERFRLVVESAPCGMLVMNDHRVVVLINSRVEGLFGYTREELIGRPVDVLIPERYERSGQGDPFPHAGLRGTSSIRPTVVERDAIGIRKDGTQFPIQISLTSMTTADGEMWLSSIVDITERQRAQEAMRNAQEELERRVEHRTAELTAVNAALAQQIAERQRAEEALIRSNAALQSRADELLDLNEELEAFSYSVSHDLRAPLRHIEGFAGLLQRHAHTALDETGRRYLTAISASAGRMNILIDDLLTFARLGRTELRTDVVSLHGLVQQVVCDLHAEIQGRQIGWHIDELPEVVADASMLRQVFANLLGNAVKYTRGREEARIEIGRGTSGSDEVVVFVRDNGVGFDPRYADRLFGVFQRLHAADQFDGNGIGLANVRRIIHRHGGRTWAEGRIEAGATFWISLPTRRPGRS